MPKTIPVSKKLLFLTSTGGSAHTTTAMTEKERLIKENHYTSNDVAMIDIMGIYDKADNVNAPWVPTFSLFGWEFFSGRLNVERWNTTQKIGGLRGIEQLSYYVNNQYIAEILQRKYLSHKLRNFLEANPQLEYIIDTQVLSTGDICHVVTNENKRRQSKNLPKIRVKKIISEFITDRTVHYLSPLSRVNKKDADCLEVDIVNSPLRAIKDDVADFNKRNHIEHIKFNIIKLPMREEFQIDYTVSRDIYLQTHQDESVLLEKSFMQSTLGNIATLETKGKTEHFHFKKSVNDEVTTISLGSQGSVTILGYIDSFIDQVINKKLESSAKKNPILFIAAGKNDGSLTSIYAKVRIHINHRLAELKAAGIKWPRNAKIIPLAMQDGQSMSSLFQNSDKLIIRAGGMTSIEADATARPSNPGRKVYIHSETVVENAAIFPAENFDICYEALLRGTIAWEGGNAQYLIHTINAGLTSPDTILHGMDNRIPPNYKDSLLFLATNGLLDKEHSEQIRTILSQGANPNMESIGGLPIVAHAKDIETLKLLVSYGAKLAPKIVKNLKTNKVISATELSSLKKLENSVYWQKYYSGHPKVVEQDFKRTIFKQNSPVAQIKGLVYQYPSLTQKYEMWFDKKMIVPSRKVQTIMNQARKSSLIGLELQKELDSTQRERLKRLIYLNQHELNLEYPKGSGNTPLSYCQDASLRLQMVSLGANPKYLAEEVTESEKKMLKEVYTKHFGLNKIIKQTIYDAYCAHPDDKARFKRRLAQRFEREKIDVQYLDEVSDFTFTALKNADTEVEQLNIIERVINFFKFLFGCDVFTTEAKAQTSQIMFFAKQTTKPLPDTPTPPATRSPSPNDSQSDGAD